MPNFETPQQGEKIKSGLQNQKSPEEIQGEAMEKYINENDPGKKSADNQKAKSAEKQPEEFEEPEDQSAEKIAAEIEKMSEGEKEKIKIGGHNIGFAIEKTKAKIFADVLRFTSKFAKEGGMLNKFLDALSGTYKNDADIQERKIANLESEEGKKLLKNSNRLKVASNILKVASYIGHGPAMTVSSFFSRGMEAVKQMRLGSEAVLDKTRIADEDTAAEEAWNIYQRAKETSTNETPSKIELQRSYEEKIPKDVLERLSKNEAEGASASFLTKMIRRPMEFSAKRLDKKIQAIESNEKMDPEEKEARKNQLLDSYTRALNDLDGIVSQAGEVDAIAAGLKYAEVAGKISMGGVMAKTLYDALEKIWEKMPDIFSSLVNEAYAGELPAMSPKQLENFNKFKQWREELGANKVFSDEELKEMEIYGNREDKAYEIFESKAKLRLLHKFAKEYAEEGTQSSWVDKSGFEHVVTENNGVRYEYSMDKEGNLLSEKLSGKPEGLRWSEKEKKWTIDNEGAKMLRDQMQNNQKPKVKIPEKQAPASNVKRPRIISSGQGADPDAW